MGRICQEAGSKTFLLSLSSVQQMPNLFHTSPDQLKAKATLTAQPEDPLSRVPQEYHKFCDVFSGEKANMLAPHWPYDLKNQPGRRHQTVPQTDLIALAPRIDSL